MATLFPSPRWKYLSNLLSPVRLVRVGEGKENRPLFGDFWPAMSLKIQSLKPYLLWLVWLVWLPFLTPNILELFKTSAPPGRIISTLVAVLLFFLIYLAATWETLQ